MCWLGCETASFRLFFVYSSIRDTFLRVKMKLRSATYDVIFVESEDIDATCSIVCYTVIETQIFEIEKYYAMIASHRQSISGKRYVPLEYECG